MNKIVLILLTLVGKEVYGLRELLKRKYPNVENGVYQIDNKGRPIKIVDVNYNHIWELPQGGSVNSYTVVKKNGKVKKFSEGTNIIYGTTKKVQLQNSEEDKNKIKKGIQKIKEIHKIKNVSSVAKNERDIDEEKRKKKGQEGKRRKELPRAMHITAEDIPQEGKQEDEGDVDMAKDLGENSGRCPPFSHYEETKTPSSLSTDLLDINMPISLEKLLLEDLEESKWISKKPIADKICLRDYSKMCPSAWEQISETQCIAPKYKQERKREKHLIHINVCIIFVCKLSLVSFEHQYFMSVDLHFILPFPLFIPSNFRDYSGPCSHVMTFEPMNAKEKSTIGVDLNWLCLNESCGNGERNYTKDCPEHWIYTGKCEAPENYSGGCSHKMDFGALSQSEKEEFSSDKSIFEKEKEKSGATNEMEVWPCKEESCERDYSITCPKENTKSYNTVETYAGSSAGSRSKHDLTANKCTYGYDIYDCPRGWINLMNSGMCKAPDYYNPPMNCPRITHFDYMNIKEKDTFSKKCNVKWLCEENSQRDYFKCPIHFVYITDGNHKGMCQPNEKYKGPCKEAQDILSLNLEQKYNFEETCEAQFPNIRSEDIPQVEQDILNPSTLEKLLKGTDTSKKGVTLEKLGVTNAKATECTNEMKPQNKKKGVAKRRNGEKKMHSY
ncbi:CPW-WPC family protein, putative [Plasmodium ovale curtisi]|uniref:CPW-WPC family protein, putative n=1 Tax=Plasmodium ovale curtisi TaxID=864141 RepID=A0A1A8VRV7_PLAOA|nr:CPW-WPC family protein, putative [Plasmodium ovale curtisi]